MAVKDSFTKRVQIDKTNTTIIAVISAAVFLVIFSLIASKTLLSQSKFQNKVIQAKQSALSSLEADVSATSQLDSSYTAFINQPQNILGGSPTGSGPNDGNNAKLVLDSLPDVYNFPELATSIEKILGATGVQIKSITGSDLQATLGQIKGSAKPTTQTIPISFSCEGSYSSMQNVLLLLQSSIRPFQFQTVDFSGSQSDMTATITILTYFQPGKVFSIPTETIK